MTLPGTVTSSQNRSGSNDKECVLPISQISKTGILPVDGASRTLVEAF